MACHGQLAHPNREMMTVQIGSRRRYGERFILRHDPAKGWIANQKRGMLL
jgi:hypothetical protein